MPFTNLVSDASYDSTIQWEEWDITGYVATTADSVIVVLSPSSEENLELSWINRKVSHDGCLFCKVHKGVSMAVENTYSQVKTAVDQHSDKKLYITGHSLGAAMAAHMAAKLVDDGYDPTVVSYGGYRVGNWFYARHYRDKFSAFRVVWGVDIVTHYPHKWMGYSHFGTEIYYSTRDEELLMCDSGKLHDWGCSYKYEFRLFDWNWEDHDAYMYGSWDIADSL